MPATVTVEDLHDTLGIHGDTVENRHNTEGIHRENPRTRTKPQEFIGEVAKKSVDL